MAVLTLREDVERREARDPRACCGRVGALSPSIHQPTSRHFHPSTTAAKNTGLLGSPSCPEVADVENPWRRRMSPDELPEMPAPRRDVVPPPAGQPRDAPAERDALDAERAARTQSFVESMWQTLE